MRPGKHIAVEALLVFAGFAAVFVWVLESREGSLTHDGFYHFRVAGLMIEEGRPWIDIRWLPLTVLGAEGPDHHWLWHLVLAPFAAFDQGAVGMTWATALTGALVPALLTTFLRLLGVPWAPLFAALAVTAGLALPGRLLMLRAQNLGLLFVFGALVALVRRRYILVGVLSFLFMQAYHGAVMLPPIVLAFVAIRRLEEGSWQPRPFVYSVFGCLAALVVNPWFPRTFEYLFFHTIFKLGNPVSADVGTEWLPTALPAVDAEAWPTHLLLIVALALLARHVLRHGWVGTVGAETWACVALGVLFLALYKSSWRFIEYYVPFACLAAGLVARDVLGSGELSSALRRRIGGAVLLLLALLLGLTLSRGLSLVARQRVSEAGAFAEIARHLDEHAAPGELVYNSNWSDFVQLFWQTQRVTFVSGLDPHYLLYGDPDRYLAWNAINRARPESRLDPALAIRDHFGSSWAVIGSRDRLLAISLYHSPHAELRVRSARGSLFRILAGGEKGER